MATSPFFVVLILFLIILLFVQYPSNTMVRAQLDSKGPILTIKCGKDHCVVLEARHFSHLASFYSRLGFTKPRTSMVRVGHWHAILVCLVSMETENKPP